MKKAKGLRVPGFTASGIHCGIKSSAADLALIVCDESAAAAGVFTRSTLVGAPVELSRERVASGRARAVVVNTTACCQPFSLGCVAHTNGLGVLGERWEGGGGG